MIEQLTHINAIQVQEYGFLEWLKEVQEQVQQGYEIEFETNEGVPNSFGGYYTCRMVPKPVMQAIKIEVDTTKVKAVIDEELAKLHMQEDMTKVQQEVTETTTDDDHTTKVDNEPFKEVRVDGRKKKV